MLAALAVAGCLRSWQEPEPVAVVGAIDAPRLAVASNGHAAVVWTDDASDGVDGDIWAVRRDAGGAWAAAELIASGHAPQVAVDPEGSAVAVWQQGLFEASRVWARRYTPGSGWGASEMLSAEHTENIDVAMDEAGIAIAVYDAPERVEARRHDGNVWRDPEVVDPTAGSGTRIAMNAAGVAFASWRYITSDGGDDSLYFNRVSRRDAAGVWSSAQTLGGSQSFGATVVVDRDGDAQAFWSEQNSGVWFERFVSSAGGWQGARQLAPHGRSGAAAGDADGNAAVLWEGLDDELHAIYLVDGEPGEDVTLGVEDEGIVPGSYDLAAASRDAIAVWQRDTAIEVSRGDATGWDLPAVLDEGTVAYPRVGMTRSGVAVAVWIRFAADRPDDDELWTSTYR
jgi:hypothetical protein